MNRLEPYLFDRPTENCGIVALYSNSNYDVVPLAVQALRGLQNRGQEGGGIATNNMKEPHRFRGLIPEYDDLISGGAVLPKSNMAIAHTMYTTSSTSSLENFQPLKIADGVFLGHNGTVEVDMLNGFMEAKGIEKEGCTKDSKLMGIALSRLYSENGDWFKVFELANPHLKGSYSVVILDSDGIVAARGGGVARPLCRGYHVDSDSYIIASESSALNFIGAKLERDVRPGELIKINKDGVRTFHFSYDKHYYCPFEFTYFSKPTSKEEGKTIQLFRKDLGRQIAALYTTEIERITEKLKNEHGDEWKERVLVTFVPDSARPIAAGFSERTGLRFEETMIKNRYRSFIDPKQPRRMYIIDEIEPIYEVIDGNYLIVLDDSIVRGNSSKIIARRLEAAGALDQAWFLAFPPIVSPCYAGIDFANAEELLAYNICKQQGIGFEDVKSVNERVRDYLGVDFVGYNTFEVLSKLLGLPCCHSCTSGEYKSILGYEPRRRTSEELKRM